jgi:prepilin-type N-terminal cleavage/methylation domain-containing protein
MAQKQKGFALIELLVVVSIIGMLSSIVLVSTQKTRMKTRDSKRIADMRAIYNALALYYADHGSYPYCGGSGYVGGCDYATSEGSGDSSLDGSFVKFLEPNYIRSAPVDPVNKLDQYLFYVYGTNGEFPPDSGIYWQYTIGGMLEDPNNPALKSSISYGYPGYEGYYVLGEQR